eukprot:16452346-Heterocapsa_arctica.AAC.3
MRKGAATRNPTQKGRERKGGGSSNWLRQAGGKKGGETGRVRRGTRQQKNEKGGDKEIVRRGPSVSSRTPSSSAAPVPR